MEQTKIICKLCGNKFKNNSTLGQHIAREHKLTSKEYYDKLELPNQAFEYFENPDVQNVLIIKQDWIKKYPNNWELKSRLFLITLMLLINSQKSHHLSLILL